MSKHHSDSESLHNYNSRAAPESALGGGTSVLSSQLTLELRLEQDCKDLLHLYKEAGDWSAVGQLAQSLDTCTSRIRELQKRLEEVQESITPVQVPSRIPESDNRVYHPTVQVGNSPKPLEALVGVSSPPTAKLTGEEERDRTAGAEQTQGKTSPAKTSPAHLQAIAITRDSPDSSAVRVRESVALPPLSSDCNRELRSQHKASLPQKVGSEECTATEASQSELSGLNQDITSTREQNSEDRSEGKKELGEGVKTAKSLTEGVKEVNGVAEFSRASGSTSDLGVDDLDQINDMMEDLVDQFDDLSKQYGDHIDDTAPSSLEAAPPPTVIINSVDSEVHVPEVIAIATDASSESSEQFFSPRNSLYSGSDVGLEGSNGVEGSDGVEESDVGAEGSTEEEQFEDAQSGSRGSSLERNAVAPLPPDANSNPIPAVFSVKQTSAVAPECSHTAETTYCVQSTKKECVRMFGRTFSPVFHTYRDFIDLRVQLISCEEKPPLQTLPNISTDGDSDADISAILEEFLNFVSRQPDLRTTPALLNFLQCGCGGVEHNSLPCNGEFNPCRCYLRLVLIC